MVEFKLMELDKLIELDKVHFATRRDLLKFGGITAAAGLLGGGIVAGSLGYLIGRPSPSPKPQETAIPVTPAAEKSAEPIVSIQPFVDPEANEIARQIGITPDKFFLFSDPKLLDKLTAFLGETLYPIYPLSVLDHRRLIYNLAKDYSIPPNVIATIMTIESCGRINAESWVGAQGLFQVMPFHFEASIQKDSDAMQEPILNGKTAMNYFVNECLPAARSGLPIGYRKDHVNVYAKALVAYNAGPSRARMNFKDLPEEAKFYADHFIRFAMSAELADGLRKKENGDLDILKKLSSKEMDARAYALYKFVQRKRFYSYDEYLEALNDIALEEPGVNKKTKEFTEKGKEFNKDYKEYQIDPGYEIPVSPGLRIWLNLGGIDLFKEIPKNLKLKEWDKIQSR